MKKVLHVVDSGGFYGKEKVVLELLRNAYNNVGLVNLSDNKDFERVVQSELGLTSLSFYMNGKESVSCLKYQIMGREWDIIHSHGFKESFWANVYSLVFLNETLKIVRTLHGYTVNKKFSKKELYRLIDKALLPLHDKVVSVTEDPTYPTIWNGISTPDTREVDMDDRILDFCNRWLVIGCAVRLSPEKNLDNLIRAIAALKEQKLYIRLLIMGEGPEREKLQNLITQLELEEHVMLAGFVHNPAKYYPYLGVYIQPSFREGLPMAVLEAAALDVIMILTPVNGMREFTESGAAIKTGTSANEITKAIIDMFDSPLTRKIEIRGKALSLYQNRFHAIAMTREYEKLYEEVK